MAGQGDGHWANCSIQVPKGGGKGKICLTGTDPATDVKYHGWYHRRSQDQAGSVLQLHFRLDPSAPRNSQVNNVTFMTTEEREAWIERQERMAQQLRPPEPAEASGPEPAAANGSAGSASTAAPQRPSPKCERLLERLTMGADGRAMQLVKLCGPEVPRDAELYLCLRTFAALQVRPKMRINSLLHEYNLEPEAIDTSGKGGAYDLQCQKSAHHLEVKVQPPLGLRELLPGGPDASSDAGALLSAKLPALLGLYHVLAAFQQDPTSDSVPLARACEGAAHLAERLAEDALLEAFLERCPVFSRAGGAQQPALRLADPAKPKSRGKLLKALFEVKALLILAVRGLRDGGSLSEQHRQLLEGLSADLGRRCCPGGVEAQHGGEQETLEALKLLVCGDSEGAAKEEAAATLKTCQTNCRSTLARLQQQGALGDLKEPNLEMNDDAAPVSYKHAYNRIWRAAVQTYLFEIILSDQYANGFEAGLRMIRFQWSRPDAALRALRPSAQLEDAIEFWSGELESVLAELSEKHGVAHHAATNGTGAGGGAAQQAGPNPRGAVGLDNPGENLCATNSLLQFLFSAESFREEVLAASEPSGKAQGEQAAAPLYTTLEQESRQLVPALRRLFVEMADSSRSSTSVREVAKVLYGGELGEQQDSDELMHRMSSLLQDGLEAISGDPHKALRQAFRRLFVGATFEVHVRRDTAQTGETSDAPQDFEQVVRAADGAHAIGYPLDRNSSNKQLLCIPVQRGNETLMQALEDFTCWAPTGGSEVVWMQEQFRTMPPFLCFATRQVSRLEWEESLNMTRFAVRATPQMLRDRYERSRARQLAAELRDSLEHLDSGGECLRRAAPCTDEPLAADLEALAAVSARLRAQAEAAERRASDLEDRLGDGFDEPPVPEFLRGVVGAEVIQTVVCGLLGADTVKKLADLVFDGDADGNDTLDQLVQSGSLARADEEKIAARLQRRREEHRAHLYDVYALVVYQGTGHAGHYVVYVRQSDDAFVCFDDERVTEHPCAGAVRSDIAERGSDAYPASVRMVVYRRRGSGHSEPLELPGPGTTQEGGKRPGAPADAGSAAVDGGDAKRRKTEAE